jgi:hypothetical protein
MRRAYKHLVLFVLVSMFVGLGMTASHAESSLAQTAPPFDPTDPNIIFILTDDMRYDDFNATYMPKTYSRLVKDPATGHELQERVRLQPAVLPHQGHHHARPVRS